MNEGLEPVNARVLSHSETALFCEVTEEGEPGAKEGLELRGDLTAAGQGREHPRGSRGVF